MESALSTLPTTATPEPALTSLTRLLIVNPKSPTLHLHRGYLLLALGDATSAFASFSLALSSSPPSTPSHAAALSAASTLAYGEGVRLLPSSPSSAWSWLSSAHSLDPRHPGILAHAASALSAQNRHDAALELVSDYLSRSPDPDQRVIALSVRALLLQAVARAHDAHSDVIALLKIDPGNTLGLRLSAQWDALQASYRVDAAHYALAGRLGEAKAALGRARELAPDDPKLVVSLARVAREEGKGETALGLLDKMGREEELGKEGVMLAALVYNDRGYDAYAEGKLVDAVRAFNKAIRLVGDEIVPVFHINRGDAHRERGMIELALADYHTAGEVLETDPAPDAEGILEMLALRLSICHDVLGSTEFTRTNYTHAVLEFTEAISHAPHVPEYYIHRARAHLALKDLERVRDDLLAALALDPQHAEGVRLFSRFFPNHS